MPIYNKLVRDNIVQIIEALGKTPLTKKLNQEEYITELRKKSQEELAEYLTAETNEEALEELADLLEIIHNLAKVHGSSIDEVENLRAEKTDEERAYCVDLLENDYGFNFKTKSWK